MNSISFFKYHVDFGERDDFKQYFNDLHNPDDTTVMFSDRDCFFNF